MVRRATSTAAWAVAVAASAVTTAWEDGLEDGWCGLVDRLKTHLRFSVFCGENEEGGIITHN